MKRILVAVAIVLMAAQPAWAARLAIHESAESPEYGRKFGGMIGRGVVNGLTGFVDILVNLVNETRDGPPLVGTLVGVSKGVGCGVLRTLSGAVDLTTFWVPGFNGIPVSDSYENCLAGMSEAASPESESMDQAGTPAWKSPAPAAQPATPPRQEEKPRYTK